MATVTVGLGSRADGAVSWEYDYDDVSLFVTAVRCDNKTDKPAYAKLWMQSNAQRVFERITAPWTTEQRNLPTQQAQRLNLTVVDAGAGRMRVRDLEGEFVWPA